MKTLKPLVLSAALAFGAVPFANADTPPTLAGPHGHGVDVSGKITLFRTQTQGLEIGRGDNYLDAEVLVTLDTQPGKVFGLRYHEDSSAARAIVETLRAAYMENRPVTLQHQMAPGKQHLKINWVQLGTMSPAFAGNE